MLFICEKLAFARMRLQTPYQFKRQPLMLEDATRLVQCYQTVREPLVVWTLLARQGLLGHDRLTTTEIYL